MMINCKTNLPPKEGFIHTSKASIKVPGYPFKIFDFANGSGSYIHLTKGAYVIKFMMINYKTNPPLK